MRRLFLLFALIIVSNPAHAAWRQADTRHFRLYSQGSEVALRKFAIKVERFDTFLRARFGVTDADEPQRLTIFMLPTSAEVARLAGQGKNVAGFYEPHATGSLAVVNREHADDKFDLGADTVLFHEYAHHFMLSNFPAAYPPWYVEGFAEFYATTDFTEDGHAKVGLPPYFRADGLLNETVIPVARLVSAGTGDFPGDRQDSFYGHSWLLLHYLSLSKTRDGQLSNYLQALNGGATSLAAATQAFGSLSTLDKELQTYLNKSRISIITMGRATAVPTKIDLILLNEARSALVPLRLAVMRGVDKKELPVTIGTLQKIAAKYPQEGEAFRLLAEAQLMAEQYDAADQSADVAITLDPVLSRALLIKAQVAMHRYKAAPTANEALAKTMKAWIAKANHADTNDPMPLMSYFRSFKLQGLKPNAIALQGLARAYQMVPEDITVRFSYAASLANQKNFDAAIRLVETIAFSPHESDSVGYATALLEKLKRAKAGDTNALNDINDHIGDLTSDTK